MRAVAIRSTLSGALLLLGIALGSNSADASYATVAFSTEVEVTDEATHATSVGVIDAWLSFGDSSTLIIQNSATYSEFQGSLSGSVLLNGDLIFSGGGAQIGMISNAFDTRDRVGVTGYGDGNLDGVQVQSQIRFSLSDSTGTAFGEVYLDEPFLGIVGSEAFSDFDASKFDVAEISGYLFGPDEISFNSTSNFIKDVTTLYPVPEPTTAALLALGLAGLALRRR